MADDFISDVFDLTRAKRVSCCAAIIWSERGGYLFSVFYVYFHYLVNDLVYIGKGKDNRFKNWTNRTSKEHSELIRDGIINCKIIANSLEESIALDIEDSLINKHKPKFNSYG